MLRTDEASVQPPEPVAVIDLFPIERQELLRLLAGLEDRDWERSTVCPGWTVKDVASHILGVDVGNISRRRDRFVDRSIAGPDGESWAELVGFLAQLNGSWVSAARRISPRLLIELLAVTGDAVLSYFRTLDLNATGERVSWAGPAQAPVWLDVAREFTDLWVHQQQIRDAVGKPGLTEARFLSPVLATFVHALPHTLRDVDASPGASLRLIVTGEAGGTWTAVRGCERWTLTRRDGGAPIATVTLDADTAWRLWTRAIAKDQALKRAQLDGDPSMAQRVLDMVSIIA